jgi:hypothetical protein
MLALSEISQDGSQQGMVSDMILNIIAYLTGPFASWLQDCSMYAVHQILRCEKGSLLRLIHFIKQTTWEIYCTS